MAVEQADDNAVLIGEVLANRYRIESRLGGGAMGEVFKARHVKMGRPFAVKVLHQRLLEDPKILQRFEREAELAGRLHHPNVIGVVDVGETAGGSRYMVMDFAEGADLATLLGEAPMPPARIVNLVRQLLEGLFHAHEQGLIHRDFKPENVIVERDDHGVEVPRIVDFGIAILREGSDGSDSTGRLTTNGLVLGTPHYMAPEQAVADPIDHRIDLFALGIVVYELLCGKLPFDGTGVEIARANLLLDPPPIAQRVPYLEVDPLLEAFARRLMAKKRELRPPTAKAARELLELIVDDQRAAAAELGVPVAAKRSPATTQPAAPLSGEPLEAPAYPATPPLDVPVDARARDERVIHTAIAEPLELPRRNRGALIAAGVVAVLAALVIVLVVGGGGGEREPNGVSSGAPPGRPETARPSPVPVPVLGPEPARPEPTEPEPTKPEPTRPEPTRPEPTRPEPTEPEPTKPVATRLTRPEPTKPEPTRPEPTRPQPTKPEPTKPEPTKPEPTKPEPTKPPERPAAQSVPSVAEVLALYQKVGSELARVAKLDAALAAELGVRYRRIQIQQAIASEASRTAGHAELQQLARRLGKVTGKP